MFSGQGNSFITDVIAEFRKSPASVKNGLTVLILAWMWHYICLYYFFQYRTIPGKHIVAGILVCIFIFSIKNWGRVLTIACNILISLEYLYLGVVFYSNGRIYLGLIALMTVALFSLASYFLMLGSSAAYYKSKMPKKEEAPLDNSGKKGNKET